MLTLVVLTREVRIPRRIGVPIVLFIGFARLPPILRRPAKRGTREKHDCAHEHHCHAEMLRANLIQHERRKQENRQHEIQQDDFESGHGCTLAAGELRFSVAPHECTCAEA